jgi:tRNA pseudouridine38-40 synthase
VSTSLTAPNARTLKLTVAYDGTRLVGWQRQAAGDSVQALLEDVLARFEGAPVVVHGAGRTDAGVHALGQVASVRLTCGHDTHKLTRALNAELPGDVRVLSVDEMPDEFHARFRSSGKTYRYLVRSALFVSPFERPFAWHVPQPLDVTAMQRAAEALIGRHDFAAFQSAGSDATDSVRTVFESHLRDEPASASTPGRGLDHASTGHRLVYEIRGDGFLRHMVRTIVGTLVEVGRGWRKPDTMIDLLRDRRRADAGPTAPPHGLFLVSVDYD